MAVSSMQAVNVIGLMDSLDEVVMVLGESGVFHPDEVSNFYKDLDGFTRIQSKNRYAEPLSDLKAALNRAKRQFPLVEVTDFNPGFEELAAQSGEIGKRIDSMIDEIGAAAAEREEAEHNLSVAMHFFNLDVKIEQVIKMKYTKARFGKLPKDSMQKLEAYKDDGYVDFVVCSEDKTHCWGVYFAPADDFDRIDKIFEGLYFEPSDLEGGYETPGQKVEEYQELLPKLEKKLGDAQSKLDAYLDENQLQISRCLSKLEELNLYNNIKNKALQHGNGYIIAGWVPSDSVKELKSRLTKIKSVELDFSDAKNEMDKRPPVKLKNCFLARPFEFYTEMYGVPRYNEMDPTLFVAITYILIFGVMFADLGQGFCLAIVGWLMWKLRRMKIGKILLPCGISSMVFGTLFGSFFGFEHVLDPLFELFGCPPGTKPIEVMAPENTNTIILGAIGIGVVLLILAMFLNVYSSIKQRDFGRALFSTSGVAGIVFYSAVVLGLLCEVMLNVHVLTLPYILGLIVLPFILIFFAEPLSKLVNGEKDWQPESWGGYIVENLFESLEVLLSYVTNTMSFLRVGAFVLVHAGMMLVVFVLGETVGEYSVGYWVIVVVGNILVMCLEALLVAIQVLRLEYYEMFSRFYSGEGREFKPVKLTTD